MNMNDNNGITVEMPDMVNSEKPIIDESLRYIPEIKDWYVPSHLQIESVNGYCNARCIMCSIENWQRRPRIMDNKTFTRILEKFIPIQDHLRYLTLHCWGEVLIDKKFPQKVKIASEMGFNSIGVASNCELLDDATAQVLINNGLNTFICSLDGITKKTHEKIRVRLDYDKCHENVLNFIKRRNESKKKVKVLIRFIRQQGNAHEWEEYRQYWESQINPEYGDNVAKFDVHNVGGERDNYDILDVNKDICFSDLKCQDVFEKFLVFTDGSVALCDADFDGFYKIGNVLETDPMKIYNSGKIREYRQKMLEGKILKLDHCKTCTIPRSRMLKTPTE